jgi:SAM-dependent methyltransferase
MILKKVPSDFDPEVYLELHPDVKAAGVDPAEHYKSFGRKEGREYKRVEFQHAQLVDPSVPSMLSTPLPDPELIHLVNGHRDQHAFDISRKATVENILGLIEGAGLADRKLTSILDFGCGCGRVLAGWEPFIDASVKLHGCDVNPELIDFCQKNISFAESIVSNYYPPLPYKDESFDLIYAGSVYTHLTLSSAQQWTGELLRILKPGGIAIISFHGSFYAAELARISREGSMRLTEDGYYVHLHVSAEETFEGSNYYATFFSSDFMKRMFSGFEVARIYPGVSHGPNPLASFQDIMVAVKR